MTTKRRRKPETVIRELRAKINARAARVRELEAQELAARHGSPWSGPGDLLRALTGPLAPAAPLGGTSDPSAPRLNRHRPDR